MAREEDQSTWHDDNPHKSKSGADASPDDASPEPAAIAGRRIVFPDAFLREREQADWLIDGLLARRKRHGVFADTGAGKTWLMLWGVIDRLLSDGVHVLYLDFELTEDDVTDVLLDLGTDPTSALPGLDYRLMARDDFGPLDTAVGGSALLAEVGAILAGLPDGAELVVVADTIGKAVAGEEGSNDTWRNLATHTTRPLALIGTTWVQLDHIGHDKQTDHARGGSAKRADLDIDWQLARDGDVSRLTDRKRRLSWVPQVVRWRYVPDPSVHFEMVLDSDATPPVARRLADWLDAMGVPLSLGRRKVRELMDDKGYDDEGSRRNVVIGQALSFRRWKAERARRT